MTEDPYRTVLLKLIEYLKQEKSHEGTASVITPSELLDKIAGMSSEIPDIRDKALDG